MSAIDETGEVASAVHIGAFLTDLANANRPANTLRAYRGDLTAFADHVDGGVEAVDVVAVRSFLAEIADQAPATRKRKRAAVSASCRWTVRHELLATNPMDRVDTITVPKTLPRPAPATDITRCWTGSARGARARTSPWTCCAIGCCSRPPTSPAPAPARCAGCTWRTSTYTAGPMFRASINGRGGPLSYSAAHHRWQKYCTAAGVDIHQLRHSHATELINAGVSIEVVRKRLGHASTETTQVYLHPARRQGRRRRDPCRTSA